MSVNDCNNIMIVVLVIVGGEKMGKRCGGEREVLYHNGERERERERESFAV